MKIAEDIMGRTPVISPSSANSSTSEQNSTLKLGSAEDLRAKLQEAKCC